MMQNQKYIMPLLKIVSYAIFFLVVFLMFFSKNIPILKYIPSSLLIMGVLVIVVIGILLGISRYSRKRFGAIKKQKQTLKSLLGGILILLLLGLFFGGFFMQNQELILLGVVLFPVVFVYLLLSFYVLPLIRAKKELNLFIYENGLVLEKKPQQPPQLPPVFYDNEGQIPFTHITNCIRVQSDFLIFKNSYWTQHRRYQKNTTQKITHLCFFFSIKPVEGYYRIIHKNPVATMMISMIEMLAGQEISTVQINHEELDQRFMLISKNEEQARSLALSLRILLLQLADLMPSSIQGGYNRIPSCLDIHITEKYVLARLDYRITKDITQLYQIFRDMQRVFS